MVPAGDDGPHLRRVKPRGVVDFRTTETCWRGHRSIRRRTVVRRLVLRARNSWSGGVYALTDAARHGQAQSVADNPEATALSDEKKPVVLITGISGDVGTALADGLKPD